MIERTSSDLSSSASRFTFNSLVRKRALDDLLTRLAEQRRMRLPATSHGREVASSENNATTTSQQTEPDGDVANIFEEPRPLTAARLVMFAPLRAASSVYSRNIDGNTLRSASVVQSVPKTTSNRRDSIIEEPSPEAMALPACSNDSSSSTSSSSPTQTSPTTATSASIHDEPGEISPEGKKHLVSDSVSPLADVVKKALRISDKPGYQDNAQPVFDFQTAMTALQKQFENAEPQHGYPILDRIVQASKIRQKIHSLDFEANERILVASDLTSCVPLPKPRKPLPGERPDPEEQQAAVDQVRYFRARLAKRVHRQIALLKLQGRGGSVRQLEDWYREVGDVVGWRELDEAAMEWGWRESDGFF